VCRVNEALLQGANDLWAKHARALLKKHQVIMLNLIGSPGWCDHKAAMVANLLVPGNPRDYSNSMNEIVFEVMQEADGGFVAECLTSSDSR